MGNRVRRAGRTMSRRFAILAVLCAPVEVRTEAPREMIGRLKDPDVRTRRLAAEELGKQKADAAVAPLAESLHDDDESVRQAAADALVRIGPKSVPALSKALRHPNESSRLRPAPALGRPAPPAEEAPPALTVALADT